MFFKEFQNKLFKQISHYLKKKKKDLKNEIFFFFVKIKSF